MLFALLSVGFIKEARNFYVICFLRVKLLNLLCLARDFIYLPGEVVRESLLQRRRVNFAIDSRILEE